MTTGYAPGSLNYINTIRTVESPFVPPARSVDSLLGSGVGVASSVAAIGTKVAGAGAKTLLGSLSAAMPWVAAGFTAYELLKPLIGRGRRQANIFVSGVQDPVSKRMEEIVTAAQQGRVSGTLTRDDATAALAAFDTQAKEFQSAADQFSAIGHQQANVVRQAHTTVDPIFAQWRKDLQAHIDALPQAIDNGSTTDTVQPPDASLLTAASRRLGAQAREQVSQRSAASQMNRTGSYHSLITGALLSPPRARARSLLGY